MLVGTVVVIALLVKNWWSETRLRKGEDSSKTWQGGGEDQSPDENGLYIMCMYVSS